MTNTIAGTQLLDAEVVDDPYPFYRRLQAEAPVWQAGESGVFAVSTFELVAEATSRVDDFSSNLLCLLYRGDDGLPCRLPFSEPDVQVLATADPPVHALHRGTVFPELVARRMDELAPTIADLANTCVGEAIVRGTVDFMTAIGNVVPITMISQLIGFCDADPEQLLRAAFDSTAMLGSTLRMDELVARVEHLAEIQAWIADQLANALRDPADDLLGAVARGVDAGVFSEFAANGMLQTLLSAGGESTTSLLGNAVRILAERPELQQHLRENVDLIPAFVEEAVRLEAPFRYLMRSVPRDTKLGGVDIPGSSTVLLLWGAANRDGNEFELPDNVDLRRRIPRRHLAFGRGIHYCVGAPLARTEARTVLTALLERTKTITLDPERPPRWVNSLMVRRHEQLPVCLVSK